MYCFHPDFSFRPQFLQTWGLVAQIVNTLQITLISRAFTVQIKMMKSSSNLENLGVENKWAFLWLYDKVIRKVILSFTPCPLFQWYPQSKKILLNLSMKCWNSAFNAQGSRVIIVVVQVGAVKIYVAAVEAQWRRSGKRKEGMKLSLPPKLVGKLVWVSYFVL